MNKPTLIIITGFPCTGKTTLGKTLSCSLKLPLISRDDYKECLFEELKLESREWSRKLGSASYRIIYKITENLLSSGINFIIESNFEPKFANKIIRKLIDEYNYDVIQIFLTAEPKILIQRFKERSYSTTRHPGHNDKENIIEISERFLLNKSNPLDLGGKIIQIDTGKEDLNSIDFFNKSLLSKINNL